jgi:hypothetical protein
MRAGAEFTPTGTSTGASRTRTAPRATLPAPGPGVSLCLRSPRPLPDLSTSDRRAPPARPKRSRDGFGKEQRGGYQPGPQDTKDEKMWDHLSSGSEAGFLPRAGLGGFEKRFSKSMTQKRGLPLARRVTTAFQQARSYNSASAGLQERATGRTPRLAHACSRPTKARSRPAHFLRMRTSALLLVISKAYFCRVVLRLDP